MLLLLLISCKILTLIKMLFQYEWTLYFDIDFHRPAASGGAVCVKIHKTHKSINTPIKLFNMFHCLMFAACYIEILSYIVIFSTLWISVLYETF